MTNQKDTNTSEEVLSQIRAKMQAETPVTIITNAARFSLGKVVATPGAMRLLEQTGFGAANLIGRHIHGDWGDCHKDDAELNELAVKDGSRVMSVYRLVSPQKLASTHKDKRSSLPTIWIITEWDRSVTTLLLPEEY